MRVLFGPEVGFENAMLAFLLSGFPFHMDEAYYTRMDKSPPWHREGVDVEADVFSVAGEDSSASSSILWMDRVGRSYVPYIVRSALISMERLCRGVDRVPVASMLSRETTFFVRPGRHGHETAEIYNLAFGVLAAVLELYPMPDCGSVNVHGKDVPIWWHPRVEYVHCTVIGVDPVRAGILGLLMMMAGISVVRCDGKLVAIFES